MSVPRMGHIYIKYKHGTNSKGAFFMKEFYLDSCGGGRLHCAVWTPEGEPKAVVQLIHGIAEHIGRYDEFARFLNARLCRRRG